MEKTYFETIINEVGKKVLEEETFFNKESGLYEDEIYIDYRDKQDLEKHLMEFLKEYSDMNASELKDALYDDFYEIYQETSSEMYHSFQEKIVDVTIEKLYEEIADFCTDDYIDDLCDLTNTFLENNYIVVYPDNYYFNQIELGFNVILDTGDGNYDFSLNTIDDLDENPTLDDESSMLWLIEQQGYNLEDIKAATSGDKFLTSVENEILNVSSGMNAVTFFVKMTVNKYLELQEKLKSKEDCNIIIPKNAKCGLVDYWLGAGSLLEIDLEKDVIIPKKNIWKIDIDDNIGRYGVAEIYGYYKNDESLWNAEIKTA